MAGRRALLTGAGGGIAQAAARDFVAEGAAVVLTDINRQSMEAIARELADTGARVACLAADVTDKQSVDGMMAGAADFMGGIDILVTCAGGYTAYGDFESIEEDDWDAIISLNLKSVYLCCRAVIPYLKANGWGRIINLGSLAGRSTSTGSSPAHYAAAKAGVSMLTQTMAKDLGPFGITANTVAPGTTKTERVRNLITPEKEALFKSMTPVGDLAEPEDIAGILTFLASDDSRYITGATIDVNGGLLMVL